MVLFTKDGALSTDEVASVVSMVEAELAGANRLIALGDVTFWSASRSTRKSNTSDDDSAVWQNRPDRTP